MLSHFDTGLVTVRLPSLSERTFLQEELYLVTGQEQLPLSEDTPDCRRAGKALLGLAMAACANQVRPLVKQDTELESPELDAAWHELGFRCEQAGDDWPDPLFVKLGIAEMDWRIKEWAKAPGSLDSQTALQATRDDLAAVLLEQRKAACVELPLHAGGHWTLLTLWRAATPEGQAEAEKLTVTYRDALPLPSGACQEKARVALSFLTAAMDGSGSMGSACVATHVLPPPARSAKQKNSTACGYFCLAWMEEDFRLYRGEGVRRLPEKFAVRAADLSRWFKRICAENDKVNKSCQR